MCGLTLLLATGVATGVPMTTGLRMAVGWMAGGGVAGGKGARRPIAGD